jgi:mono/diheme cytochrome c family protein
VRSIATIVTFVIFVLTLGALQSRGAAPLDGQGIFRYDTFGSEQLWTGTLRMHEALGSVTPAMALDVGLKVDSEALPPPVKAALQNGQLDVTDPRVTRRLLELDAVVGVIGRIAGDRIKSIGITCALCHSTVDNALGAGIGRRLDGWPNLDLNVGAIVGLSPALGPALKAEFALWGRGKYDPRHHAFDGSSIVGLNTPSIPVVLPPVYGLRGVGFETFTGDGPISYWNSYVAVTQMGGQGRFVDSRIGLAVEQRPDRVTSKLPALLDYQLSLLAPPPPAGTFDPAARERGRLVFNSTAARCSTCHIPTANYTDVLSGPDPAVPLLHAATAIGANPSYAARSATAKVSQVPSYRTTPLRALWQHPPYFHDGHATTLAAVVEHYVGVFDLALTTQQKADLVEFLKSL